MGGTLDLRGEKFDPHTVQSTAAKLHRLVYEGLLGYDLVTYDVQPDLAQKWEQPSPTEYIFTLAPGIKWQNKPPLNGRELRAEDVVFSLERARTDEPQYLTRTIIASVDKIEAVDRDRVRITTRRPDVSLLAGLASDGLLILAPEVVERAQKFVTPEEVVGTGAFMLKSVQAEVSAEYVRNPDYWKPGLPYLDGVRTQHFEDDQTAFAAFLAGNIDICRLPGTQVKKYIADQGPNYTPRWFKQDNMAMTMPNTKVKPLDDSRVTRALRLLTDHQEMITAWAEVLFGHGGYDSIFASALDAWDVPAEEYTKRIFWKHPKDDAVKEALALLAAAGFSRTNPLQIELATLNSASVGGAGELLHTQWRRLGQGTVEAQIKLYDGPTSNTVRARRTFTYALLGNSGAIPEPSVWLNQLWRSDGSRNYMGFANPRVDEMIDQQSLLFDTQQRRALVKEIILYMMEHSPGVSAAGRANLNGVNRKVRGFAPEYFMNGRQYQWVWLDT